MKAADVLRMYRMAQAGMSRKAVAREMELHYATVQAIAAEYKMPFKHGLQKDKWERPDGKPRKRTRTPIGQIKAAGILDKMTERERSDSLIMMRKGAYSAVDALRHVGRDDLIPFVEKLGVE